MKLLFLSLFFSFSAHAETGFVTLPDHQVYVDYEAAEPGKPTVVLINGLVYDTDRWNQVAAPLLRRGFGVLRYDFRGQGATLRKEVETGQPSFFQTGLEPADLALELKSLMDKLKIKKASLVGLSFGAGIAASFAQAYPERVDQLVFLSPLVVSLDHYDEGGKWLRTNLDLLRLFWGPLWGPYVYDYYYNQIFRAYMNQRLVPERIPEDMRDITPAYKESVFHLVRAMRDFNLRSFDFARLSGRVHMFVASQEEEPALRDQFLAWRGFKKGASFVYFQPAPHAIPDGPGALLGDLLQKILERDDALQGGKVYRAPADERNPELERFSDLDSLEKRVFP